PQSEREILNIERKIQVNEKMYTYLLEKRANTIIAKAGIVPKTKVIEKPRSFGVVRPNRSKYYNSLVGAGLLLAALIAFIRSVMFHRIESVRELSKASPLSVLGGVPIIADFQLEKATDLNPKSAISESFRAIRTNLGFLGNQKE